MKKILILDFSQRLPGPLATRLLCSNLFEVLNVEYIDRPEPFLEKNFKIVEPIFSEWSTKMNKEKELIQIKSLEELSNRITKNSIAIGSFNKEEIAFFKENNISSLIIRGGHGVNKHLHDLNALMLSDSFSMNHNAEIPYLPFAGINFAQSIKSKLMEIALTAVYQEESIYLEDETKKVFDLLASTKRESKFLHNGKYPCYNLYKTKDSSLVCLGAIEEKFWSDFLRVFKLNLTSEDRFSINQSVFKIISNVFLKYSSQELQDIVSKNKLLITIKRITND